MSEESAFYHGVLAALAVIVEHDQPTIARDIANTVDAGKLWAFSDEYEKDILRKSKIGRPRMIKP